MLPHDSFTSSFHLFFNLFLAFDDPLALPLALSLGSLVPISDNTQSGVYASTTPRAQLFMWRNRSGPSNVPPNHRETITATPSAAIKRSIYLSYGKTEAVATHMCFYLSHTRPSRRFPIIVIIVVNYSCQWVRKTVSKDIMRSLRYLRLKAKGNGRNKQNACMCTANGQRYIPFYLIKHSAEIIEPLAWTIPELHDL